MTPPRPRVGTRANDGAVKDAVTAIEGSMEKLDAAVVGFGPLVQELRDLATGLQNLVAGVEGTGEPPRARPTRPAPGRARVPAFIDVAAVLRDRTAASRR